MAIPAFQHNGRPVVLRAIATSRTDDVYGVAVEYRFDTAMGPPCYAMPGFYIPAIHYAHAQRIAAAINNATA
jgi:hypothetical protein